MDMLKSSSLIAFPSAFRPSGCIAGACGLFWNMRPATGKGNGEREMGDVMRRILTAALFALAFGGSAWAEGKTMVLAADARLEASGLLQFLVPRFALKSGIRVTVEPGDAAALDSVAAAGGADALIAGEDLARAVRDRGDGERLRPAFRSAEPEGGGDFAVVVIPGGAGAEHALAFADWLTSEIGRRTVASFDPGTGAAYLPGAEEVAEEEVALPQGDAGLGEELAHAHCGRCHVVSEKNRFGGIGSTPSFGALRAIPTWQEKFQNFWGEPPHPVFLRVEGLTEPFDPDRPPHIAPVEIDVDELAAIVAFAASITPKDLGAAVRSR